MSKGINWRRLIAVLCAALIVFSSWSTGVRRFSANDTASEGEGQPTDVPAVTEDVTPEELPLSTEILPEEITEDPLPEEEPDEGTDPDAPSDPEAEVPEREGVQKETDGAADAVPATVAPATAVLGARADAAIQKSDAAGSADAIAAVPVNKDSLGSGKYTIKFKANPPDGKKESDVTGTMQDQICAVDVTSPLRKNAFRLTGYDFVNWSDAEDPSKTYEDRQGVLNIAEEDAACVLEANWVDNADPVIGIKEISIDEEGFGPTSSLLVSGKKVTYRIQVTDNGSGVQSVKITSSDPERVLVKNGDSNYYFCDVTAVADETVHIVAEDHAGRKTEMDLHPLILEEYEPVFSVYSVEPDNGEAKPEQRYKIRVTAQDMGVTAGVKSITYRIMPGGSEVELAKNPTPLKTSEIKNTLTGEIDLNNKRLPDGKYTIVFKTTDFCGNSATTEPREIWMDNTKPEIAMSLDNGRGAGDDGHYYYKADNSTLTLTLRDEQAGFRGTIMLTDQEGYTATRSFAHSTGREETFRWDLSADEFGLCDGPIRIRVVVNDMAGNRSTLADASPTGWERTDDVALVYLDTTPPELTKVSFTAPAWNGAIDAEDDYTVYYGGDCVPMEGVFIVADDFIDENKIVATTYRVEAKKSAEYRKEDAVAETAVAKKVPAGYRCDVTADAEGAYWFAITAEDKAGNKLVLSDAEKNKGDRSQSVEGSDGLFCSKKKVIDTTAPEGLFTVYNAADSAEIFYALRMKRDGKTILEEYEPFQRLPSAETRIEAFDLSPTRVKYTVYVNSSVEVKPNEYTAFEDDASQTFAIHAEGIFKAADIVVMDRAGNRTECVVSNPIYLDRTSPNQMDMQRPTATIQASTAVTRRSADGRDLFNSGVTLRVTAEDPNGGVSGSGLKRVWYTAKADGHAVQSSQWINYEKIAQTNSDVENPRSRYEDEIWIASGGSFETNDIEVTVWAEDNAGNVSEPAIYRFGIDTVGPKITVSFDNNAARNGKYFNNPRNATITIAERNLDPRRISVNTQVAVPGEYNYAPGDGANDRWTKVLNYANDGVYTLSINGTDALGNSASVVYEGTMPQDFVVDRTVPVITVGFNNNNVRNGKYFKDPRTATITINERNFNAADVQVAQSAKGPRNTSKSAPPVSGFSSSGDIRSANIAFTEDGTYAFTVNCTDLAGNLAQVAVVNEFVLDRTRPVVRIDGVRNAQPYGGLASPVVSFEDDNFSEDLIQYRLTGTRVADRSHLLPAFQRSGDYGGKYAIDNIPILRRNDDIYTAVAKITDLAGNESQAQVSFSVNRFGSTWDYCNDRTTMDLNGIYYTNTEKDLVLREININRITGVTVTLYRDGENRVLRKGEDYTVEEKRYGDGGMQYIYRFSKKLFAMEGNYDIIVQTKDEAGNINTNTAMRGDRNACEEVPIRFAVDKTSPTNQLGGFDRKKERYNASSLDIFVQPEDNMLLYKIVVEVDGETMMVLTEQELQQMLRESAGRLKVSVGEKSTPQVVSVYSQDAAGNTSLITEQKLLVTQNLLAQYFYNRPLFFGSIIAMVSLLLLLLTRRMRRKKNGEERL